MGHIRRQVEVGADPKKCFDFIADPDLAPLFISSLHSITPLEVEPRGQGNTWEWEYDLFGIPLSGASRCVGYDPPNRYVWETYQGIDTRWTYTFEPANGGTQITLEVEYELPDSILGGKLGDRALIDRLNEHEADAAVRNLQVILEES